MHSSEACLGRGQHQKQTAAPCNPRHKVRGPAFFNGSAQHHSSVSRTYASGTPRGSGVAPTKDLAAIAEVTTDYLEGQGDLVSRLITPITHIVTTVIPLINLLTKSP